MRLELKNDTVLIKLEDTLDGANLRQAFPGFEFPDSMKEVHVDASMFKDSNSSIPVLIGEIVEVGPGKKTPKGKRIAPPELQPGIRVLFQIDKQIAFEQDGNTLYLVGVGNVLGLVE